LAQVLADHLLVFWGQALELRIIRHDASLQRGRQFTQAPEKGSGLGRRLLRTPAGAATGFHRTRRRSRRRPSRGICALVAAALRKDQGR
jgi:hypothetical protein